MFHLTGLDRISTSKAVLELLATLAFLISGPSSSAELIVEVLPASVTVAAGSTENELDLYLVNDDDSPLGPFTLSVFSVTLTIPPEAGILFTGGDSSIPNYLLGSNSTGFLFSNPVDLNYATNIGTISDAAADSAQVIAPGTTVGLGRMYFLVSAAASNGTFPVIIDTSTSLTGGAPFGPLQFAASDGEITITGGSITPAPSAFIMASTTLGMIAIVWAYRRLKKTAVSA